MTPEMSKPLFKSTGVFPLRGSSGDADELMTSYTAESPLGSFVFRMKFPASTSQADAAAMTRKKIADVCRSIALAAEGEP